MARAKSGCMVEWFDVLDDDGCRVTYANTQRTRTVALNEARAYAATQNKRAHLYRFSGGLKEGRYVADKGIFVKTIEPGVDPERFAQGLKMDRVSKVAVRRNLDTWNAHVYNKEGERVGAFMDKHMNTIGARTAEGVCTKLVREGVPEKLLKVENWKPIDHVMGHVYYVTSGEYHNAPTPQGSDAEEFGIRLALNMAAKVGEAFVFCEGEPVLTVRRVEGHKLEVTNHG